MLLVLLLIYPLVISRTIKLFIWNDLLHYDAILAESFPSEGWETPPPKKLEKTLTELTFKATKVELAVLRYTYVMGSSNQTKGSFSLSVRQETSGNSTLKVDFSSSLHYRTNLPVFSNMTWQLLTTNSTDCTLMDDGWVEKSPGQADNNLPNELFCFSIFTRAVQSASKILETIPEPEKSTFFWVRSMFTNPDFFRASLVKDAFHEKYNSFGWMRSQIEGKQLSWQNVPRNITELAALAPPKFRSVSKCPDLLLPANANKRAIVFYCLHKRSSQTQCEWVETEEGVYISPLVAVRDGGHGFWCTKWGFGPLLCTADFDYSMQGTFLGLKLLPYMCLIEQSAEDLVPYNEFENWISASVWGGDIVIIVVNNSSQMGRFNVSNVKGVWDRFGGLHDLRPQETRRLHLVSQWFGSELNLTLDFRIGQSSAQKRMGSISFSGNAPSTYSTKNSVDKWRAVNAYISGVVEPYYSNMTWYSRNIDKPEECYYSNTWREKQIFPQSTHLCLKILIQSSISVNSLKPIQASDKETLENIKNCFYRDWNTTLNRSSIVDGFDSNYNALGFASGNATSWIKPFMNSGEADGYFVGKGYSLMSDCGLADSQADLVLFCKGEIFERRVCEQKASILYGSVSYTTAAVRMGDFWCIKFGYGPLLCTPVLQDFGGDGCRNKTGLYLGEPGRCYTRRV